MKNAIFAYFNFSIMFQGEKYVDSSNKDICCGRCVQEACVDEKHILHYPQTNWTSENGCIKYECTPEVCTSRDIIRIFTVGLRVSILLSYVIDIRRSRL